MAYNWPWENTENRAPSTMSESFLFLLIVEIDGVYHHRREKMHIYILPKYHVEIQTLIITTGHRVKFAEFKTEKSKFSVPWDLNNEGVLYLTPYFSTMDICIIALFRYKIKFIQYE